MDDDVVARSESAESWLEAFPWIEAVETSGYNHPDNDLWWRKSIEPPDSEQRSLRLAQLSELAVSRLSRWTLGQIFPGLSGDIAVDYLTFSTRARNLLKRRGCHTTADLQDLELAEILDWPNTGAGTVDEILQALADAATGAARPVMLVPEDGAPSLRAGERRGRLPERAGLLISDVRLVARWLVALGAPDQPVVSDVLRLGAPPSIVEAQQRINRLAGGEVLDDEQAQLDAAVMLHHAISSLDLRAQEILTRRLFADRAVTLDELGQGMGVTPGLRRC